MARSTSVAVGTTAVPLATAGSDRSYVIHNNGPNTVYMGGSDTSNLLGFPVLLNAPFTTILNESEGLYAVCAAGQSAVLIVFTAGS